MPLLGAWEFLGQLSQVRTLWISGKLGSLKSALAYRIGLELVKSGSVNHIVSNCRDLCSSSLCDVFLDKDKLLNTVIITDEAGTFIRRRTQVDNFVNYARKLNIYYLFPSHKKPHVELTELQTRRLFDWRIFGINIVSYRWWVGYGRTNDEQGVYHWINPAEIYGIYDTSQAVADDAGIMDWLYSIRESVITRTPSREEYNKSAIINLEDAVTDLEDLASNINGGVDSISAIGDILQSKITKKKF